MRKYSFLVDNNTISHWRTAYKGEAFSRKQVEMQLLNSVLGGISKPRNA